jgi:phosphatidylglycerophosphatase A
MSPKTDPPLPDAQPPGPSGAPRRLSWDSLVATGFGLGYLPFAPGTWGSLEGVLIYWLLVRRNSLWTPTVFHPRGATTVVPLLGVVVVITLAISGFGLIAADALARKVGEKDPQFVVIDEVSGQLLTYLVALAPANWKYLLLGFILFRLFDIWKPFPARQAESFPGGWGIMADDWMAGIYAGLGLWLARALGL